MFETAAACPPGLDAVHMYKPESDLAARNKFIFVLPTIKRSASDPVMAVNPLIQLTFGSGKPVTSHVIVTGVPVSVVTWLPALTWRALRLGSNTWMEMFDESMTGNVGSVGRITK